MSSYIVRKIAALASSVSLTASLMALSTVGLLFIPAPAMAQDLTTTLTAGIPLWQPGHSITTSIKDALPVVTTLTNLDEDYVRPIPADWNFAPGHYRGVIRSYCLHAGTYGPTKGDGYLITPLKGDRAGLIRNILLRSQKNPQISQEDVQRLIWGTEDGAQWDSFDDSFKLRAAPLLSAEEIALLNIEPKRAEVANEVKRRLGGLIPGKAQQLVDTFADLRNKITSIASYAELEKIAVKTGNAPWGKDSRKDVQPGPWAYVGDGFFMRAFPEGYPTTTLEIYRVAKADVKRDDKGRITHFDCGGYLIDTTYDDTPATKDINGKNVPIWNFKSVTFRHPDGRTKTYENRGYVVVSDGKVAKEAGSRHTGRMSSTCLADDGGLGDMDHYHDGLKKATDPSDMKGKFDWMSDHLSRVSAAWNAATNALAGQETKDARPKKFDPTKYAASPANTSKQRLALSAFSK